MLYFLLVLAMAWTAYWLLRCLYNWDDSVDRSEVMGRCAACAAELGRTQERPPVDNRQAIVDRFGSTGAAAAANEPAQTNVKPLFDAPSGDKDNLKIIKGIGVVMEGTLNDLGITTFKQLAGFDAADIRKVMDALDESNSGFGDRIERDAWVAQAKEIVRKAA